MREEHLDLCRRKSLSARIAFIQAALPHELRFQLSADGQTLLQQIKTSVELYSNQQVNKPSNETNLSSFLDELSEYVERVASPWGNTALKQVLLDNLRTEITRIRCEQCSPSKICNGHDELDTEIVENNGQCIIYFRALYDIALRSTIEAYKKYATLFSDPLPKVIFSTGFTNAKPHDAPVECYVSGTTTYIEENAPYTRVKLICQPQKFCRNCFFTVPYVLFHECIAHAFRAAKPTADKRGYSEPDDPFDEGWMDFCAYLVFERNKEAFAENFCTEYLRHGRDFHESRSDFYHAQRSVHSVQVALGMQAAQKTLEFLSRLPESANDPVGNFLRLSFDFNLWKFTNSERRHLVACCDNLLPKSWELPAPIYFDPAVVDTFRHYLKNRDISLFFNKLAKLQK